MSTASPKVIAVLGATGNQGGSVITALLPHSDKFTVVGVTRNTSSDAAKALAAKGVKLVTADVTDKSSLVKAFEGVWGVFGNTNSYDSSVLGQDDIDAEVGLGKNVVDAAVEAKASVLVWSSLPSSKILTQGKYHVPHFQSKAVVAEYALSKSSSTFKPTIVIAPSFHENLLTMGPRPSQANDGSFNTANSLSADVVLPHYSVVDDTGKYVTDIFLHPEQNAGKTIEMLGEWASFGDIAKVFSKVFNKKVTHVTLPEKVFASFLPPKVAADIIPMFQQFAEFGYGISKNAEAKGTKLEEWVVKNKNHPAFEALRK